MLKRSIFSDVIQGRRAARLAGSYKFRLFVTLEERDPTAELTRRVSFIAHHSPFIVNLTLPPPVASDLFGAGVAADTRTTKAPPLVWLRGHHPNLLEESNHIFF